jgi:hypothetical protein
MFPSYQVPTSTYQANTSLATSLHSQFMRNITVKSSTIARVPQWLPCWKAWVCLNSSRSSARMSKLNSGFMK